MRVQGWTLGYLYAVPWILYHYCFTIISRDRVALYKYLTTVGDQHSIAAHLLQRLPL